MLRRASPQPGESAPPGSGFAGLVLLMALLALMSGVHQFHRRAPSALPVPIMETFGLSESDLGSLSAVFFTTYAAAMIAGGWLADRIGTYWTLLMVAVGSVGASLVVGWEAGLTSGFGGLLVVRGVMGLLCAPLYPSTSRTIALELPQRWHALANGLVVAAAPLGIALAKLILGPLARQYGWRRALLYAAIATLPLIVLWLVYGGRRRRAPARARGKVPLGPLFRHRGMWCLSMAYFAVGYFEYFLMDWLKYYFEAIRKVDGATSEWYAAFPDFGMMVCAPLGGLMVFWLSRRLDLRRALRSVAMVSMVMAALCLMICPLLPSDFLVVVALTFAMGFLGASEGPAWAAVVWVGGRNGALAAGIMNTAGNVAGIIEPKLTPWISTHHGWNAALIVTGAICLLGVFFWLWVDVDNPAQHAENTPVA